MKNKIIFFFGLLKRPENKGKTGVKNKCISFFTRETSRIRLAEACMKNKYISIFTLSIVLACAACGDGNEPAAPFLATARNELSFTGAAGTQTIKIDATRRWHAVASDYWIIPTPDSYPSAGEHFIVNVAVTVDENDSGRVRTGTIAFYLGDEPAAVVTVNQDKGKEDEKPAEESPVTWANLQWAAASVVPAGSFFEAGCCVFADVITNTTESTTGETIGCDIGYSVGDTPPDGDDWTWTACWFNGDWGDNFYYQGRIENELPAGTYYYTFRLREADGPYRYAGTNGLWDGVENGNGIFTVE